MSSGAFRVVVIGAGIAGLFMTEKLKRAQVEFTVYEKSNEVGGTWRDNVFPGLFVDVFSRQYEFPFRPNYDWSRVYAPAEEIQDYILRVTRERDLRRHIQFGVEVKEARFQDGRWHLKMASGATDTCDALIFATGFLNRPVYPDIQGRDSFAGKAFHSARWDSTIPYEGNRWGVIGSGASGIQITEALAWAGANVTQFIRRAQWIHIRPNPHYSLWEKIFLRLPGGYKKRQKELWDFINTMDRWRLEPGPQRDKMQRDFAAFLDIVKDPELKKKLTPDYPLGCTRIPKSDRNYYEAVQLPNVQVVKGAIQKIVPEGIVMSDGTLHPLDVLVYATGFDPHAYMRPMNVVGQNGVTIDEVWKENVHSYRGVALPGFPNLFMLYGPFSPVNNIPVPMGLDHEIAYILRVIDEAKRRNAAVAPSAAALDRFLAKMKAALPGTVWTQGCKNWYSDQEGTPILWPFPQEDHKRLFEADALEDLEFTPRN